VEEEVDCSDPYGCPEHVPGKADQSSYLLCPRQYEQGTEAGQRGQALDHEQVATEQDEYDTGDSEHGLDLQGKGFGFEAVGAGIRKVFVDLCPMPVLEVEPTTLKDRSLQTLGGVLVATHDDMGKYSVRAVHVDQGHPYTEASQLPIGRDDLDVEQTSNEVEVTLGVHWFLLMVMEPSLSSGTVMGITEYTVRLAHTRQNSSMDWTVLKPWIRSRYTQVDRLRQ